ncbi:MAG: multiheme c-type cytochrome [Planctomycetota bacterium]|nr:multiheme c-type cytochrome [Planctomycetota bacterium]
MDWKLTFRVLFTATALAGVAVSGRTSLGVEPAESVSVALRSFNKAAEAEGSAIVDRGRHFLGVGSCSASNCHGGDGTRGAVGSEYSIWIQADKHAEAFSVLYNETSQRMARLLKLDKPAHQAVLCLNCHAPQNDPPFARASSHESLSALLDGVSCEACHGAASDWLGPHVRRDWSKKSSAAKAALGFRDTRDLWTRGKACADCHVGEAGRDVNHDLYAAGHPRLFFEMSAFNANMPAHWDRNDDRERTGPSRDKSSFEAKLWAIGQLASAEAALDLLIHRADTARDDFVLIEKAAKYPSDETVAVWPEFAETGCFACHHNLDSPSWRQKRGYASRNAGGYPWGTWLFPILPTVVEVAGSADLTIAENPLARLTAEMARPYPNRTTVVSAAKELQAVLTKSAQTINSRQLTAEQIAGWMMDVSTVGMSASQQSWDGATQSWLSLTAIHQGWSDVSGTSSGARSEMSRQINSSLEQIRGHLEFPVDFDSPRNFTADPATAITTELKKIHDILK